MALTDLGRQDATKGRHPLSYTVFYELTKQVIVGKKDIADDVVQLYAELMQDYYMDGYNDGKEVAG